MSKGVERLLTLRQRMEDDAAANLTRARSEAERCRENMSELTAMRNCGDTIPAAVAAYCDELARDARVALSRRESESAAAEAVVIARRRDRKQMEHLLHRVEARAARAAEKREQQALDEWAVARWQRVTG